MSTTVDVTLRSASTTCLINVENVCYCRLVHLNDSKHVHSKEAKMRKKTTERINFGKDIKKRILSKSDNACAHCKKPLTIADMTIDHMIPLSKGGTNEESNLIALCFHCNTEKDDDVVNPISYYKYLKEEHAKAALEQHKAYCEDISWLTTKNYLREDRMQIQYSVTSGYLTDHQKRRGNYVQVGCIKNTAILYKAKYEDLEDVKAYLVKYHKKYELDTEDLDELISDAFTKGCIYVLKKGSEIIALFPVSIERRYLTEDNQESYIISFSGIPIIYQKSDYVPLIKKCLDQINAGAVRANGKNIALYEIMCPENDDYLLSIVNYYVPYGYTQAYKSEDGWKRFVFCQRWVNFEGELNGQQFDPDEDTKYFSQALERIMNLKPTEAKEEKRDLQELLKKEEKLKQKSNALKKERKRADRDMIDEYDERYYNLN